ncbi:GNAT family N-acetyltransferase [Streptomyces sp. NPDC060334]|uniref:GNAT family N-acetyltransferase n=1 Tax=Streptomyces sp. NPDC060334 TaxID=3347099 RepID=UPI0036625EE4
MRWRWRISYGAEMLTVRAMVEADVAAVSAIRVTGWKAAYVGIVPRSHLDGMTVEADTRRRRQHFRESKAGPTNLVAVDTLGRVVGWACFGPFRGAGTPAATGELYALYVQPSLIGSGIGRTLLEAGSYVWDSGLAAGFLRPALPEDLVHGHGLGPVTSGCRTRCRPCPQMPESAKVLQNDSRPGYRPSSESLLPAPAGMTPTCSSSCSRTSPAPRTRGDVHGDRLTLVWRQDA